MPPPFFRTGQPISTKSPAPARICLKKGYRRITLPLGEYTVVDTRRDETYWHDQEHSDGYTYRLQAKDETNAFFGERISIWQNDLADAVFTEDEIDS